MQRFTIFHEKFVKLQVTIFHQNSVVLCFTIFHQILLCYVLSYSTKFCYATFYHIPPNSVMLCFTIFHQILLCYVLPYSTKFCYATFYHIPPNSVMLRFTIFHQKSVVLHVTIFHQIFVKLHVTIFHQKSVKLHVTIFHQKFVKIHVTIFQLNIEVAFYHITIFHPKSCNKMLLKNFPPWKEFWNHRLKFQNYIVFQPQVILFVISNSANPAEMLHFGEMSHYVAFHQVITEYQHLHLTVNSGLIQAIDISKSGSTVAQWKSAWFETEGQRVRASPASLGCDPWARHISPRLVLVQPRKTHPCLTERLLMEHKESNQTNKQKTLIFYALLNFWLLHFPPFMKNVVSPLIFCVLW